MNGPLTISCQFCIKFSEQDFMSEGRGKLDEKLSLRTLNPCVWIFCCLTITNVVGFCTLLCFGGGRDFPSKQTSGDSACMKRAERQDGCGHGRSHCTACRTVSCMIDTRALD